MNTAKRGRGRNTATRGRGRGRPRAGALSSGVNLNNGTTETSSPSVFKCPACQLVFTTEDGMTNHKMTHSELYDFECGQCDMVFETLDVLKNHFYSVHMGGGGGEGSTASRVEDALGSESVGNSVGGVATSSNVSVNGDSNEWDGDTFDDGGGGSTSPDEDEVVGGTGVPEKPVGPTDGGIVGPMFQCEQCPKLYKFKNDLDVHLRTHSGERPYLCSECGKTFGNYRMMTEHLKRHNADYTYFCEVVGCGKGFVRRQDRDRHEIRSHVPISQRPKDESHMCSVCGKYFTQRVHLKAHMPIHGDSFPFPCTLCGKGFKQSSGLRAHMKSKFHGGTGLSHYNKKKPKKNSSGGTAKRGRKRKVPEAVVQEEDEDGEESEGEDAVETQKTDDDEYVPPTEKHSSNNTRKNVSVGQKTGVQMPTITSSTAGSGAPQLLPHHQPQGPPPQSREFSSMSYHQQTGSGVVHQHQQNYWNWKNSNVAGQQGFAFGQIQGQQAQVGQQQQLFQVPVGVLTLQDAFQMGYGIGGDSGGGSS